MLSRLKRLFAKPPAPEFRDEELGVFTFYGSVWMGKVRRDGRDLRFSVAGTETAPDAGLLGRVRSLLAEFADVERAAIQFLRSRESELHQARLEFYSFELLWEDKPDDFTFEFLADRDDSRVWRADFVAGQPRHTGFDD